MNLSSKGALGQISRIKVEKSKWETAVVDRYTLLDKRFVSEISLLGR